KPANPAPSANTSSRCAAGTSFAFGFPYISTNWAKTNSIPRSSMSLRTSFTLFGRSAIPLPLLPLSLHAGLRRSAQHPKLHDLHGDGERQPVLTLQVQARDPLHPGEPLAQRVRMDVEGAGGPNE